VALDIGSPPSIIVRQVFVTPLGVKVIPTLPACIVGEHFQIEERLLAGLYTGVLAVYTYPDKVVGAVIQTPGTDVQIFLETLEDDFDVTAEPGVIITADDFTLPAALSPSKDLTDPAQVSTVAGTTFTDPNALFITDSIRQGDILTFDTVGPLTFLDSVLSAQAGDYTVLNVINEKTLQLDTALIVENKVEYKIRRDGTSSGTVRVSYKAQRFDLVNQLLFLQGIQEGEQQLGRLDTDENPLGLGFALAAQNTSIAIAVTAVSEDTSLEHQRASEFLEGKLVYAIVPLSQDPIVFQVWQQHVDQQSDPERGFPRVVLINPIVEDFFVLAPSRTAIAPVTGPPDSTFVDAGADFGPIPVGSVLHITAVTAPPLIIDGVARTLPFQVQIASKNSTTSVEILGVFTTAPGDVTYSVRTLDFSNFQKANNVRQIARSFADRRVWLIFPDQVETSVEGEAKVVPGYYAAAAYAGLRSELSPSQPMSQGPISGFTRVIGSNELFSPDQLRTIQSGGVTILTQRILGAPIIIRRQLTTDISSEKVAEQTGTVVPDFMTYFLQEGLQPIVGRHVITNEFLENQLRPGINSLIRDAVEERVIGDRTLIVSLGRSETTLTSVEVTVDLEVLDPVNFIDITLRIS
jgi:hypothetical protein